jgi:hypothetical protein
VAGPAELTGTTWRVTRQSNKTPDRGQALFDARRCEFVRPGLDPRYESMPKAPAEKCGIRARAVRRGVGLSSSIMQSVECDTWWPVPTHKW